MSPYKHPNTLCSHSGDGVEFCHDYGLVFFISVHVHLLLASGEKRAPFFEFRTIIPLDNHCFGDRPFLPFEVGRARAIAVISLAWLKLPHDLEADEPLTNRYLLFSISSLILTG